MEKMVSLSTLDVLKSRIDNFEFIPGETAFASLSTVIYALVFYCVTILVLKKFMEGREPIQLTIPVSIHNLALSAFSLISLVVILYDLVPMFLNHGFYSVSCDPGNKHFARGRIVFLFYLFYLSKMYEFIDTFLQVLRKKNLLFLHVYHHITTVILCWITIQDKMAVQWVDITANLFVHIVMYYYYFLCEQGIHVWWKKYITRLQITQFVWDMSLHAIWYTYKKENPSCGGTIPILHASNFIVVSFLLLFIRFYIRAYNARAKTGDRSSHAEKPGQKPTKKAGKKAE